MKKEDLGKYAEQMSKTDIVDALTFAGITVLSDIVVDDLFEASWERCMAMFNNKWNRGAILGMLQRINEKDRSIFSTSEGRGSAMMYQGLTYMQEKKGYNLRACMGTRAVAAEILHKIDNRVLLFESRFNDNYLQSGDDITIFNVKTKALEGLLEGSETWLGRVLRSFSYD